MRVLLISFVFFLGLGTFELKSQISTDFPPYSTTDSLAMNWIEDLAFESLPSINLNSLLKEDAVTDQHKDIPWRFGTAIEVNYNMQNSGDWKSISGIGRLWALKLQSDGASSLNLNFNKYYLPKGASLHIYSEDRSRIIGAFTSRNNREDSLFNTTLIKTDAVILEYFEPAQSTVSATLQIESVVHGYREISELAEGLNSSGGCNINVNCAEGAGWQDEKRSVLMILLANNTRVCTGTLLNNARNDGTPYVLSANHCPINASNVFVFNYESPDCNPSSEPGSSQSINGCVELANNSSFFSSDFSLMRLSSTPPLSYNSFYAGWSSINQAPRNSAGIHHPRGDVKKISIDYDAALSTGYYTQGDNHWAVLKWDVGTTEDASSGSSLFNEQHRIVGQLHGGDASCTSDTVDFYGKFSTSWNSEPDSNKQLKFWLDPDGSGVEVLDGFDPNRPLPSLDAQVLGIGINNQTLCGDSIRPEITIKNGGSAVLNSLDVTYYLDGVQLGLINWSGTLNPGSLDKVTIPALSVNTGNHQFEVRTSKPNGGIDQKLINDILYQRFFSVDSPVEITLTIKTDDFGNETKWQLVNLSGTVVESFGDYPGVNGGATYTHQFCLYSGCYNFVIIDTYGDGFCCGSGQGSYLLQITSSGDTIDFNDSFSTFADTSEFCLGDSCTILVEPTISKVSSSSAADGSISVEVIAGNPPFTYNWSNGGTSNSIDNLPAGNYQLTISDSLGCEESFSFDVQLSTGISENIQKAALTIYPNPTNGKIMVNHAGSSTTLFSWKIYDLNGKLLGISTNGRHNMPVQIDLSGLEKGLYLLEIIDNSGSRDVRKIILQ